MPVSALSASRRSIRNTAPFLRVSVSPREKFRPTKAPQEFRGEGEYRRVMSLKLDFSSGIYADRPPQSVRRLRDIAELFAHREAIGPNRADEVVNEIHGSPAEVEGPGRLLHATTILHPGTVEGEYFMTRGHFHTDPNRGELMFNLSGKGEALLMDRDGKSWTEPMTPGSVHDIDGRHAHRVVNTGTEPLIFLVTWMSDCGHDYESIREKGFGMRLFAE